MPLTLKRRVLKHTSALNSDEELLEAEYVKSRPGDAGALGARYRLRFLAAGCDGDLKWISHWAQVSISSNGRIVSNSSQVDC